MSVERATLAPGYSISRLIKGGWQLAGGHGTVDERQAIDDMARFVEAGITTFDCADIYTGVETLIGRFIKGRRASAVPVQVHTKFVPDLSTLGTIRRHDVSAAIERSLDRLGVERLDLVQLHWWDYAVPRFVDVAGWLTDLQAQGKIRFIGLTNFGVAPLEAIAAAGVPLASHQVQYSLLDRRPAVTMTAACRARGIGLLCYGALAGGFLSSRWLGVAEPTAPHANRSLTKYHLIIEEFGGWTLFQDLLTVLADSADRHGVGIGAVAIRYVLDQPQVAAVIVGATSARYLEDTLQANALVLSDEDRRAIDTVVVRSRGPSGDVYGLERVRDGRHARIMRYELNSASQ